MGGTEDQEARTQSGGFLPSPGALPFGDLLESPWAKRVVSYRGSFVGWSSDSRRKAGGWPSDGRQMAVGQADGRSGPTAVLFFLNAGVWGTAATQFPGGVQGVGSSSWGKGGWGALPPQGAVAPR